jgi:hypothetical protein
MHSESAKKIENKLKIPRSNENENTANQDSWNTAKAVLR